MLEGKALNNVHKLVFMFNEWPNKTVLEVSNMIVMTPIDYNVALWRAQDMNYLTIDTETNIASVHEVPETWDFGPEVQHLRESIIYMFKRLARDEADLEENTFGNWAGGFVVHDVFIAMKQLLNDRVLAEYEINDIVVVKKATKSRKEVTQTNNYKFYTCFENLEMRWGQKQFKNQDVLK